MVLENKQPTGIVKAVSPMKHQGQLYGAISNGTGEGVIQLENGYALKIIRHSDIFVQIVLLDYGKDITLPRQTYVKSKKVIVKKIVEKKPEIKQGMSQTTIAESEEY